ncbi:MAG: Zn-dependent protease [Polyangiales bacterium]|jgi:Zn-dependent protease
MVRAMEIDPAVMRALPVWFTATLLSLTVHEAGHAFVGGWGGDDTARDQVTLNPTPHVTRQPFGMLLVPIISFVLNGGTWMIGFASAPYDPGWAVRFPKKAALMAAAGPISTFLIAITAGIAIHIGIATGYWAPSGLALDQVVVDATTGEAGAISTFVSVLFSVNVLIGFFNLIPVAPLDGHAIVPLFLNARLTRKWFSLFADRSASIFGFMIAFMLFSRMYGSLIRGALWLLYLPLR